MARRRLKLPSTKDIRDIFTKSKTAWPLALVLAIVLLILILLWWLTPYYNDIYKLLPGFYQNSEYDELVSEKSVLVDENVEVFAEVQEIGDEISQIEASLEGYQIIVDKNSEMIALQESAWETTQEILDIDEELLSMRLPETIAQYVRLAYELDLTRKDMIELALELSNARRDAAEMSVMRGEFDDCLADVDWAGADKDIADAVSACAELITPMQEKMTSMEDRYEVELEGLSMYLPALSDQWRANAAYYLAISQGDYTKANEHDEIFVENKRVISEIDVEEAFSEFYVEAIGPMTEEFIQLQEEEVKDAERADQWYENNVLR